MAYSYNRLKEQLGEMGIDPRGTLLVHSSMKAIGEVEGGAQTVLDVLCDYMRDGLLIFPTHTWAQMDSETYSVFDVRTEPSCVGILSELFRQRPGVVRSLHPTHSVAALGRDAVEYTSGEENAPTPCWRNGCWGRLYDRGASILFLGSPIAKNTFLHSVEEWCNVPGRLNPRKERFTSIDANGVRHTVYQNRHIVTPPGEEAWRSFDKLVPEYLEGGALRYGQFGDAKCALGDAVKIADIFADSVR